MEYFIRSYLMWLKGSDIYKKKNILRYKYHKKKKTRFIHTFGVKYINSMIYLQNYYRTIKQTNFKICFRAIIFFQHSQKVKRISNFFFSLIGLSSSLNFVIYRSFLSVLFLMSTRITI